MGIVIDFPRQQVRSIGDDEFEAQHSDALKESFRASYYGARTEEAYDKGEASFGEVVEARERQVLADKALGVVAAEYWRRRS